MERLFMFINWGNIAMILKKLTVGFYNLCYRRASISFQKDSDIVRHLVPDIKTYKEASLTKTE